MKFCLFECCKARMAKILKSPLLGASGNNSEKTARWPSYTVNVFVR